MRSERILGGIAFLVAIAVLAATLIFIAGGGERQNPPCECPNTESIVPTIDWFGDGTPPNTVGSAGGDDGLPEVGQMFNHFIDLDDAMAGLDRMYEALVGAGVITQAPPDMTVGFLFDLPDANVTVIPPLVETNQATEVIIDVALTVGDEDAAAALQPLIDALGTTD